MSLYIKKAFEIIKENIVLAQPPIFFMIIFSITFAALAQQTVKLYYIIFSAANIMLCTAFFAGWFYMIKKGIEHHNKAEQGGYKDDKEKASASFSLGKEFFPGVGIYFPQVTYTAGVYAIISVLLAYLSVKFGMHYLTKPDINWTEFMAVANSTPAEMQKYVYGLSFEQLKALNIWMLYLGGIFSAFSFLTMFLFPAVMDSTEKGFKGLLIPFTAFNKNIVFVFKNFFGVLGIIVFLFFLNIIMSLLSMIFNMNFVLAIIGLILSFYVMTYAVILIFLFYEERK